MAGPKSIESEQIKSQRYGPRFRIEKDGHTAIVRRMSIDDEGAHFEIAEFCDGTRELLPQDYGAVSGGVLYARHDHFDGAEVVKQELHRIGELDSCTHLCAGAETGGD